VLALAFDTSTPTVSVAVVRDGTVLVERSLHVPNAHGESLAPLIRQCLDDAGAVVTEVDVIGVGLGPGPFTGLRVGVVTAAGLADAIGVPAHGMCSLDAVAALHQSGEPLAVLTDARRKQVYWATYDEVGARVGGPDLARPDDLALSLAGRVGVIVGAGALLYAEAFEAYDVRQSSPWPSATAIARHASTMHAAGLAPEALEPLYLRRPDARPPAARKRVTPA
jgi:tRNA threonylcarbamoyl adenosine modification protein YeaZ